MKKQWFLAAFGLMATLGVAAQTKVQQTVKIPTPTVQCGMCKNKIESYLKRYDGVVSVNVVYKPKETKDRVTVVKYLTDRTNEEIIKAAIANAGYKAGDVEANPEAYKALPQCCKKPEDGGGMKE